ncbi:hypothetical protein [Deinococcus sp. QL22]|uniref:hypothetical protein n=1 Tax=Deinococcus sp. QL22 TaxID=2939437 RepID=UPI002016AB93|nr:hypothetical protein [Deinococcus sp. QL22]UQN09248.1 hypothetical protein M1R55_21975 [Deinococcus sp. QL22]
MTKKAAKAPAKKATAKAAPIAEAARENTQVAKTQLIEKVANKKGSLQDWRALLC